MSFALFVLLNAILLIRPEELIPGLLGVHLYLIVICICLITLGQRILCLLRPHELRTQVITICVLGVWGAGIVSQLARGNFGLAFDFALDFGTVILYYLLLIAVIDSPARLRSFLGWLVIFIGVSTALTVLQFHEFIDLPALRPLERSRELDAEGNTILVVQLRGAGVFNDPNDICLVLTMGSICALARAYMSRHIINRLLWLLPTALFGYALVLSKSRGGLLGLLLAIATLTYNRFGWRGLVPITVVLIATLSMVSGGRQTDFDLDREGTTISRVLAWSDGFNAFMRNPITGIGVGHYADETGIVAHNSFVHAYVEMGIIGGSFFVGAFYFGTLGLSRLGSCSHKLLAAARPFVLAMLLGYAGGIFSLSRNYVIPTYLVLGLAQVVLVFASRFVGPLLHFSGRLAIRLMLVGCLAFVLLKVITSVLLSVATNS